MRRDLINILKEARDAEKIGYVCFFNDKTIREDHMQDQKRLENASEKERFDEIEKSLIRTANYYGANYDFDRMDVNIRLGLIYKKRDVDNYHINENAEPIQGIVRYFLSDSSVYLGEEKKNEISYRNTLQGFIRYNLLISAIEGTGLSITELGSFEEFKKRILSGNAFDITISADLRDENQKELRKQ